MKSVLPFRDIIQLRGAEIRPGMTLAVAWAGMNGSTQFTRYHVESTFRTGEGRVKLFYYTHKGGTRLLHLYIRADGVYNVDVHVIEEEPF